MYFHQILPIFFFTITIFFQQHHSTPCFAARTLKSAGDPELVAESCKATRFPDLCSTTFADFSSQSNPKKELASIALGTTISEGEKALATAETISSSAGKDCVDVLKESQEQLKTSVPELEGANTGETDFAVRMGNVKTWVSSALTDEDTCSEGVKEAGDDSKAEEFVKYSQLTSIALALINNYANP